MASFNLQWRTSTRKDRLRAHVPDSRRRLSRGVRASARREGCRNPARAASERRLQVTQVTAVPDSTLQRFNDSRGDSLNGSKLRANLAGQFLSRAANFPTLKSCRSLNILPVTPACLVVALAKMEALCGGWELLDSPAHHAEVERGRKPCAKAG